MADKPTGKTKRWRERMTLLQLVLRAKEGLNRSAAAIDDMARLLFEEEMTDPDVIGTNGNVPPPSPSTPAPAPPSPRGAKRLLPEGSLRRPSQPRSSPTQSFEAVKGEGFARVIRLRYAEARTDDQRESVRALLRKAHATETISTEEFEALDEELQK